MHDVAEERETARAALVLAHQKEAEVSSTLRERAGGDWERATQARVTYRHMRAMKKGRREHEREFANALGRQVGQGVEVQGV